MKWPDCPLKRGNSYSYFKDIHPPIFEFKTLKLFLEFLQSDDTPRILKTPNIDTYYIYLSGGDGPTSPNVVR